MQRAQRNESLVAVIPERVWLMPSAFAPHVGGVEEVTLRLARSLQKSGSDVLVVTNRWPLDLPARENIQGVDVARTHFSMPARRPSTFAQHLRQRKSIDGFLDALPRPSLVHLHCGSSQLSFARRYAKKRHLPLVFTTHGESVMDAQGIYQKNPYLRRQYRRTAAEAAVLTACSEWTRRRAAELAPSFDRARVVLNGVDPGTWNQARSVVTEPVFAAYGRHVPQKGFDLLLEAFAIVLESLPKAQLLLGGHGPEYANLQRAAGPQVSFSGKLDTAGVVELLASCRVVVVPSRIEPFGIVALEALGAGRGLVYADSTGLAEAAGSCGRQFVNGDAASLAAQMLSEVAEPTSEHLGRARAQELSWESITARYLDAYAQALS